MNIGYSCPALAAVRIPVSRFRIPTQAVMNISSGLFAQTSSLNSVKTLAGDLPCLLMFDSEILEDIINSAAGIPLPETSAITIHRCVSSTRKKS